MRSVVGYIRRHSAQRHHLGEAASRDVEHTKWAHSLKNWGHDPTRD
jgi:hypothetical protein